MLPKQALSIGINTYTPSRLTLRPCINDARDLSNSLQSIGFQVKNAFDTDLNTMKSATHHFINSIQPGAVVVFYFSGHGVQCNGNNYLIPSDAAGIYSENITSTAIDAQKVIAAMYRKSPRVIICILDCCRTNPPDEPLDASPKRKALSGTRFGLAPMLAPPSTIVVYACAANDTASPQSKSGRNSLYTYHLLRHIRTPNADIEAILKLVAADVQRDSHNDQIPYRYSSCNEMICLTPYSGVKAPVELPLYLQNKPSDRKSLFLFEVFTIMFYQNLVLERGDRHRPRQMPVPHILHLPRLIRKSSSHSPNHHAHHHESSKNSYDFVQKPSVLPTARYRPAPGLLLLPDSHRHHHHHGR